MLNVVEWKTLEDTVWNHPLEICPLSDKILPVVEYEDLTNQVQKYMYYFEADNLHGTDRIASQLIMFPDNFYSLSDWNSDLVRHTVYPV